MLSPALELKNVVKYFHDIKALDEVCLKIAPGSIHGIIGENGAGKSTLLKVAYGLITPEHGQVFVDGVKVNIENPQHAIDSGIGMLHQTTKLGYETRVVGHSDESAHYAGITSKTASM